MSCKLFEVFLILLENKNIIFIFISFPLRYNYLLNIWYYSFLKPFPQKQMFQNEIQIGSQFYMNTHISMHIHASFHASITNLNDLWLYLPVIPPFLRKYLPVIPPFFRKYLPVIPPFLRKYRGIFEYLFCILRAFRRVEYKTNTRIYLCISEKKVV